MLNEYRKLLRIEQWYKNLLIFFPLLFAPKYLIHEWQLLLIGLIGFCCVSSSTYIINDWVDREKDAIHPTKKFRPLASGKISGKQAIIVSLILLVITSATIFLLGKFYAFVIITYFILTNLYSAGLKNLPIIDLALITFNFILRSLAGMKETPSLTGLPYYLALFSIIFILLNHKRRSDIKLLGEKAASHKPVLQFYTKQKLYFLRFLSYIILILSLYLLAIQGVSIITLISTGILVIITSLIFSKNPSIVMKPHYLLKLWYWDLIVAAVITANIFLQ